MATSPTAITAAGDFPRYCVILPTYNNAKTLKKVLDGVLAHTVDIIVVNDGATDRTAEILLDYPQIEQLHLPKNKGKGYALRMGFKLAESLGFDYAITIDSDGQHFPDDIPVLLQALQQEADPTVLYIGSRNMGQEGIPKKSSFGNRFSNFWFWVETGIRLQDTQSGFRLYPLTALRDIRLHTNKFELEIEVIVKAAWSGIPVKNVPIRIHYDTVERVSHFRPFTDFTRISILNTYLVLVALFYIYPRDLFRKLKKKGVKRFVSEDLLGSHDTPEKKALSIALGTLIGLSPLWGLHTLLVLFLAVLFRLNKAIAFAFSNISLPPFIPFVLYLSLKIGHWVLGNDYDLNLAETTAQFELVQHLRSYIVGSIVLAVVGSLVMGTLGYLFLVIFDRKKIEFNNG